MNLNSVKTQFARLLLAIGVAASSAISFGLQPVQAEAQITIGSENLERYLIQQGFDSGEVDGVIPFSNAQRITRLDLRNMDINSLNGIESFGNLEYLDLSGLDGDSDGEDLQFSSNWSNKRLRTVKAVGSKISEIRIEGAPLETLDVSANRNLRTLEIYSSKMKTINLSGATDLEYIVIRGGSLSSIDLTEQTKLTTLVVNSNRLATLNLAPAKELTYLDVSNNVLSAIDLSKNPNLQSLQVGNNNLTTLDLSKNPFLSYLGASKNKLTAMDLSKNPSLENVIVASNKLTSLSVAANTKLEGLSVANNKLTKLDVSNLNNLLTLDVAVNRIKSLDLRSNPDMISIDASYNPVRKLQLPSDLRLLMFVNISGTSISRLDLRGGSFTASRDGTANFMGNVSYGGWGIMANNSSATLIVENPTYIKTIMGTQIDDDVKLVRK